MDGLDTEVVFIAPGEIQIPEVLTKIFLKLWDQRSEEIVVDESLNVTAGLRELVRARIDRVDLVPIRIVSTGGKLAQVTPLRRRRA